MQDFSNSSIGWSRGCTRLAPRQGGSWDSSFPQRALPLPFPPLPLPNQGNKPCFASVQLTENVFVIEQIYLRGSCGEIVSIFYSYAWVFSLKL